MYTYFTFTGFGFSTMFPWPKRVRAIPVNPHGGGFAAWGATPPACGAPLSPLKPAADHSVDRGTPPRCRRESPPNNDIDEVDDKDARRLGDIGLLPRGACDPCSPSDSSPVLSEAGRTDHLEDSDILPDRGVRVAVSDVGAFSDDNSLSDLEPLSPDASMQVSPSGTDSEAWEDTNSEADHADDDSPPPAAPSPHVNGCSSHGYVHKVQQAWNPSSNAQKKALAHLNDDQWAARLVEGCVDPAYVELREKETGSEYVVPLTRAGKARICLSYESCLTPLSAMSCECRRKCYRRLTNADHICALRKPLHVHCKSEDDAGNHIVQLISNAGGTKKHFYVQGEHGGQLIRVCRRYFCKVYGIGANKAKKCLTLAQQGSKWCSRMPRRTNSNGNPDGPPPQRQGLAAHAFWTLFFSSCQKPNDEVRLFPSDKTYNVIYKEYFEPWFQRLVRRGNYSREDKPSLSTLKRVRRTHEDFKDVKKLKKHWHGRCRICDHLGKQLLKSFTDGVTEREYLQQRRLHDQEVKRWLALEEVYKAQAKSNPQDLLLIMHDGTGAMGLPRVSRRGVKNLETTRYEVTPWLAIDYSGGKNDYIYSSTSSTAKDTNYLLTMLHAIIRRAKSDYGDDAKRFLARKLVCIQDSASENKNNWLLAYCTELVEEGWFDEVELLYGPVGHTHNGVDAAHKIHNQNVGRYQAGDLGHFVSNYPKGFNGKKHKMPNANVLGEVLDWKSYYDPHLRRISGFTNTSHDSASVRGFRIAKNKSGSAEVTWKADPALEKEWRGEGGYRADDVYGGFFPLLSRPEGVPKMVPHPTEYEQQKQQDIFSTFCNSLKSVLKSDGLSQSVDWCHEAAVTGRVPIHRYLEDRKPPSQLGRLCEVGGTENLRARMRVLEEYWEPYEGAGGIPRSHMWKLAPGDNDEHIHAKSNLFHFSTDESILRARRLPLVRYAGQNRGNCEAARHQNNIDGGWIQDPADGSESSHNSGDDQPDGVPQEPLALGSEPSSLGNTTPAPSGSTQQVNSSSRNSSGRAQVSASRTSSSLPGEKPAARAGGKKRKVRTNDATTALLNSGWRFETDFKDCKVGSFCVLLNHYKPTPGEDRASGPGGGDKEYDFISVGKIVHVNKEERLFKMQKYETAGHPWHPSVLKKQWHSPSGNHEEPHYAVIKYFTKFNAGGKLPKAVTDEVQNRRIQWALGQ